MHLFDPQRPKASTGLPQVLGSPLDLVPNFYVFPLSSNSVELLAFLRRDSGGHSAFRMAVALTELSTILQSFIADPEAFLLQHFQWTPPRRGHAAQALRISRPLPQESLLQIQKTIDAAKAAGVATVEANADDF